VKSKIYEAPHYAVFSIVQPLPSFWSKYSPQHPVIRHHQSMFPAVQVGPTKSELQVDRPCLSLRISEIHGTRYKVKVNVKLSL